MFVPANASPLAPRICLRCNFPPGAGFSGHEDFPDCPARPVGAVVVVKLLPLAFAPVIFVLGLLLLIGGLLVGGVAATVAAGLALLVGLLAGGVALAVVLSPIWIPVLAIVGLIALIKRLSGAGGRPRAPSLP